MAGNMRMGLLGILTSSTKPWKNRLVAVTYYWLYDQLFERVHIYSFGRRGRMLYEIFNKPSSWREPWLRDFVGVTRSFLGSPRSVGPNFKLHYQTGNSGFSSHNYFHFHSSSLNNIRQKWEYRRWEFPQGGAQWHCLTRPHPSPKSSVSKSAKVKISISCPDCSLQFLKLECFRPLGVCVHWKIGWW